VPNGLVVAATWSLCLIAVGLGIAGLGLVVGRLSEVVFPLFSAFLLTAALQPLNAFLVRRRWPAWLAALTCLLFLVFVVGGLLTLVGVQIGSQWEDLSTQTVNGFRQLMIWLSYGPMGIRQATIDLWIDGLTGFLMDQQELIASMAASIGAGIVRFLAGLLMCLFAIFFFLKDGRRFTKALRRLLPPRIREVATPAASAGWTSMVSYVRAAVTVAAVDGVGAGLGAMILGSNLWVAIMALTFVCAFVPMLGALVAGAVGCIIVLATLGWIKAIIMLVIFVVVLETEVHVMQPLLLGRAVDIHPLAVLASIALGMSIAGIAGAIFAIPIVALLVGVVKAVYGRDDLETLDV